MDIEKLEAAAKALKLLIAEQKSYQRVRDRAAEPGKSPKQMQKLSADIHYAAMHLRRLHKDAWRAIKEADLETTLGEEVAKPHGFHNYKI
jgi:hypothetical protein